MFVIYVKSKDIVRVAEVVKEAVESLCIDSETDPVTKIVYPVTRPAYIKVDKGGCQVDVFAEWGHTTIGFFSLGSLGDEIIAVRPLISLSDIDSESKFEMIEFCVEAFEALLEIFGWGNVYALQLDSSVE